MSFSKINHILEEEKTYKFSPKEFVEFYKKKCEYYRRRQSEIAISNHLAEEVKDKQFRNLNDWCSLCQARAKYWTRKLS